ncbi:MULTISPECIES: hypothetical protein [unclassified Chelatococcus]|uniref:hypothetical protein n=1 Tax=unclassified Chelatococcus TaxID=2638111 RepID=UPI001BD02027|nr:MULTISPECIES: hypothetical protein [unclassified Chelatococcus]MBS7739607.1 hypothetical protein [Chelatococcus sp. HY11]MBX3543976.1 hypothetical protein [Chelatococcus sp.]MCO5075856.1 hypothetical protein [Chelatococcus sp.]
MARLIGNMVNKSLTLYFSRNDKTFRNSFPRNQLLQGEMMPSQAQKGSAITSL